MSDKKSLAMEVGFRQVSGAGWHLRRDHGYLQGATAHNRGRTHGRNLLSKTCSCLPQRQTFCYREEHWASWSPTFLSSSSPSIYLRVIFTPKNKEAFYSASGENPHL